MINGRKVLAIIPARGGSKRIPAKNLQRLGQSTLLEITILHAKESLYVDKIVVSSENTDILKCAENASCETLKRPEGLASDVTPGIAPVLHVINQIHGYDYILLLQVTSPFRKTVDIDNCIEHFVEASSNSCVSVVRSHDNPDWMFKMDQAGKLIQLYKGEIPQRSQDLSAYFSLNGAIYIATKDFLIKEKSFLSEETVGYIMPPERSLDIDTPFDLKIARALWKFEE